MANTGRVFYLPTVYPQLVSGKLLTENSLYPILELEARSGRAHSRLVEQRSTNTPRGAPDLPSPRTFTGETGIQASSLACSYLSPPLNRSRKGQPNLWCSSMHHALLDHVEFDIRKVRTLPSRVLSAEALRHLHPPSLLFEIRTAGKEDFCLPFPTPPLDSRTPSSSVLSTHHQPLFPLAPPAGLMSCRVLSFLRTAQEKNMRFASSRQTRRREDASWRDGRMFFAEKLPMTSRE